MKENQKENLRFATSDYWETRRSVRNFTSADVPDNLIFSLIQKAAKAPTTGGMQLYSVVITRNPSIRTPLAELHFNQPAAVGAPLLITVVADFNRFNKWCIQKGAVPGFNNFESFIAAFTDAVIFAQQLATLLELHGLGTCYLGTTTYNASRIGELLKLPFLTVPAATLAVGWPAAEGAFSERLPAGALIHKETYQDYSPARIEEIFAEKEALPHNRDFVRENKVPSLAHVFTDIRYPAANAEIFSKDFYDYLKRQGFHFPTPTC